MPSCHQKLRVPGPKADVASKLRLVDWRGPLVAAAMPSCVTVNSGSHGGLVPAFQTRLVAFNAWARSMTVTDEMELVATPERVACGQRVIASVAHLHIGPGKRQISGAANS